VYATVHIGDCGVRALPRLRRAAPKARSSAGLRYSLLAVPAPLGTGLPLPQVGRFTYLAFWDDGDAAARAFVGTAFDDGFEGLRLDLEAVRSIGSWPGIPSTLPSGPMAVHDGPAVIITIGRLRMLQARRFFAASAKAEKHIVASNGLTWATGMAAPERRTVVTVSWWHDQLAMGHAVRDPGGHRDAMARQAEKDFHHESAFTRFRPLAVSGSLEGRNAVAGLTVD
jgi:hypothetical protein